ncbi:hypothetical protein [Streptomyces sp. NPDC050355]|uniref:Uncharacterized protein n=1 Tax=Streptomyces sirii TaxID=3127701 RepID=A0ABZ2QHU6_9ACTN
MADGSSARVDADGCEGFACVSPWVAAAAVIGDTAVAVTSKDSVRQQVIGLDSNGPVTLDAKTGADRSTSPGAAPVAVNAYTGVALDAEHRTLIAHPATA